MNITLTFLGAAQNVTGSQYLVQSDKISFLVDCGLYQERELTGRNWGPFLFPPERLEAVLLTHAHLDHCGLLPKLAREGFNQAIYCTSATSEITEIMLMDSGKIQEEDADFKRRRHEKEKRKGAYPEVPLYTRDDAEAVYPLFSAVKYGQTVQIGDGAEATFYDAGHVLGSAMVRLKIEQNGEARTILFSGDVGRRNKPILNDPTFFEEADYVIVESTNGDRLLESPQDAANQLAETINSTVKRGGNIVIPSFALERSQELLYYLNQFLIEGRIPHLLVFVDSPMAVEVTGVFERHPELFDQEMRKLLHQQRSPFDFPGLELTGTVEESKAINHIKGSAIIIAGSGMCTGGRIKHHLVNNISREESTVLFVGYQAAGTLGRQIVDGAQRVRILGQYYPVKAKIAQLNGFSAHADRNGLLRWLSSLRKPPRRVFVTHGELDASQHLADLIKSRHGWETIVPSYQERVFLD
jgi:metallo-beta-lactamase family protein